MTDRYTLLSELGRGGMGVVWKARDEETGATVAVKLLRDVYADDPDYVRRFEREAELAQRIDSIHVVKVLDYGLRDKVPYLALEYIDGPSLHDALTRHGPYIWPETRAILAQLAQGLADANAAGVIHRDIKPSNILIAPDGTAKLTDFGIARGLNFARITATAAIVGTPAYLAPEGPKDARSDLYSLGIIGYELLTGTVPFKGTTYHETLIAHIRETPDLSILPEEARPAIGWLLAKEPADRPQRASALLPVVYGAAEAPEGRGAVPSSQPMASAAAALPVVLADASRSDPPTEMMAAQTVVLAPPAPVTAAQTAKTRRRLFHPLIAVALVVALVGGAYLYASGPRSSLGSAPTPLASAISSQTVGAIATPTVAATVTPTESASPSPTPVESPSPSPSPSPSLSPTRAPTPAPPKSSIGNVTVTNNGLNLYTVTFDYFYAGEYGKIVMPDWVPSSCTGSVQMGGFYDWPLLTVGRHSLSLEQNGYSTSDVQCSKVTVEFLSDMNHTQLNIARVSKTVTASTNWAPPATPVPASSQ
jgi:serine/threonine protein kinase